MSLAGGPTTSGVVLVVGDLMVDVVVTVDQPINRGSDTAAQVHRHGGGSAANTACWLGASGISTRLLAAVGDDEPGREATALLRACNVDHLGPVVAGVETGTCVVIVDQSHERTMFPDRGANAHLDEVDLAPLRALPPRRVHVSGYALLGEGSREAARSVLAWARDVGATVSVDAASAAPLQAVGAETFLGWVEGVDELFANDDEVAALGGVGRILRSCRVLVHKHGKRGATWDNGRLQHAVAARDVVAVDSTGAGDAFAAGWLAASIRGADVPACLRAASDLAAQAVTVVGARPHRP